MKTNIHDTFTLSRAQIQISTGSNNVYQLNGQAYATPIPKTGSEWKKRNKKHKKIVHNFRFETTGIGTNNDEINTATFVVGWLFLKCFGLFFFAVLIFIQSSNSALVHDNDGDDDGWLVGWWWGQHQQRYQREKNAANITLIIREKNVCVCLFRLFTCSRYVFNIVTVSRKIHEASQWSSRKKSVCCAVAVFVVVVTVRLSCLLACTIPKTLIAHITYYIDCISRKKRIYMGIACTDAIYLRHI